MISLKCVSSGTFLDKRRDTAGTHGLYHLVLPAEFWHRHRIWFFSSREGGLYGDPQERGNSRLVLGIAFVLLSNVFVLGGLSLGPGFLGIFDIFIIIIIYVIIFMAGAFIGDRLRPSGKRNSLYQSRYKSISSLFLPLS